MIDETVASKDDKLCLNCGAEIENNYCSECGQETDTGRLNLKTLLFGFLEGLVNFEQPLYRTLKGLTIRPGKTIAEYTAGKRRSYTNPVKFVITTSAILILIIQFRGTIVEIANEKMLQDPNQIESISTFLSAYFDYTSKTAKYSHLVTLLHMPIMALLFRFFFRKTEHSFTDFMAFGCFVYGYLSLFNAAILAFNLHNIAYNTIVAVQSFVPVIYITWSSISFNKLKFFSGLWRSVIAFYLFILINVLISFLIVALQLYVFK